MSQLLYPTSTNAVSKQLNANYTAADAVITLTNTTNVQNKPGVCLINRVDTNETLQPTANWTYIEFTATSGATLTGCTAIAGDQDQALGKVVEFVSDVTQQQRILDCLVAEHNDDGTHSTITATSIDVGSTVVVDSTIDDDTMATATDTSLATSESIKAYVDGKVTTDGWTASADTWVYASASTFTIAGVDRTTTFTKGTRLKFTQTTVKYAVVVSSAFSTNTTVTIAVNTDYTIANAAITLPYYSYQACPAGYPNAFTLSAEQKASITGTAMTIWGWGFNAGNGNWYTTGKTVTYGIAFVTAPSVSGSCIGQKTGSDPTTIGDFSAQSLCMFSPEAISTTQFSAAAGDTTHSTAVGATLRIGYSWIAIGTI